ncbi:MAG: hypothetical protein ACE5IR_11855 [bacterium]
MARTALFKNVGSRTLPVKGMDFRVAPSAPKPPPPRTIGQSAGSRTQRIVNEKKALSSQTLNKKAADTRNFLGQEAKIRMSGVLFAAGLLLLVFGISSGKVKL